MSQDEAQEPEAEPSKMSEANRKRGSVLGRLSVYVGVGIAAAVLAAWGGGLGTAIWETTKESFSANDREQGARAPSVDEQLDAIDAQAARLGLVPSQADRASRGIRNFGRLGSVSYLRIFEQKDGFGSDEIRIYTTTRGRLVLAFRFRPKDKKPAFHNPSKYKLSDRDPFFFSVRKIVPRTSNGRAAVVGWFETSSLLLTSLTFPVLISPSIQTPGRFEMRPVVTTRPRVVRRLRLPGASNNFDRFGSDDELVILRERRGRPGLGQRPAGTRAFRTRVTLPDRYAPRALIMWGVAGFDVPDAWTLLGRYVSGERYHRLIKDRRGRVRDLEIDKLGVVRGYSLTALAKDDDPNCRGQYPWSYRYRASVIKGEYNGRTETYNAPPDRTFETVWRKYRDLICA